MHVELKGIVRKPAMNLVGLDCRCSTSEKENYQKIAKLWSEFNSQLPYLTNRLNKGNWQKFGVSFKSSVKYFTYASCVPVTDFNRIPY